jgi:hypothetical protein
MHIVKARGSDVVYIVQALVPYLRMRYKQAYNKVMKEKPKNNLDVSLHIWTWASLENGEGRKQKNGIDVVITHLNVSNL